MSMNDESSRVDRPTAGALGTPGLPVVLDRATFQAERPRGDEPRVVHLELHTHDLLAARGFYAQLLEWETEVLGSEWGTYHALPLGEGLSGGIVECGTRRACWLPYVEVDGIEAATERARSLGATVLLAPREGPAGWRSVLSTPAGGEIALWKQKR